MNKKIFFSIIIPTFNRAAFLETAINSVLNQTYPNFELIIINDGSNDSTKHLIDSYSDIRLSYSYHPNHGVSFSRNKGLAASKGEFIAFLDSDDRWAPEKLKTTMTYIQRYPEINIFHTEEIWYRNGELLPQLSKHKKPTGWVYTKALPLCCIGMSTSVINRSVFDDIGIFDETLEACEDYDFWLRSTNKYEVKLIPEELTIKDGGRSDQLSSKIWGLDRFRIKALEKMLLSEELTKEKYNKTFKTLSEKCRIFALGAEKRGKTKEVEFYRNLPSKYNI